MDNQEMLRRFVHERNAAMSIFHNSADPLVQDFAFIDVQAAEKKIAKLQEIAKKEDQHGYCCAL